MASKKLEYSSSLGGPVELGTHLPTFKYAASVLTEMRQLVNNIKQPTATKLIFQTLPKHMRRRAMSHHPKRLPRKYRAAHMAQMSKSGKPQQGKRPSRKHRRRPKNLLNAYLRRQRKNKWLETHIWHAKRFHMVQRWGYQLPYASCDKTYRACYRATTEHCLLQDISFYACIEMSGTVEELKKGFQRLTSRECSLSVTAKTYLTGRREGYVDFFKDGQYPYKALGKINFIWCPVIGNDAENDANTVRTLWIWTHPCSYQCILEELVTVFVLKTTKITKVPIPDESSEHVCTVSGKTQRRLQFMTKINARQNIPTYKNATGTIELKELKDTMNRFRLTGPLSQRILSEAFKVKELSKCEGIKKLWIHNAMEASTFKKAHTKQKEFWERCQNTVNSPTDLLSNMVLALNIEDPRLHRPKKRTTCNATPPKSLDHEMSECTVMETSNLLSYSALWQQSLRDRVSEEMLSTHAYCSLREEQAIVPGHSCPFEETLQPVPVLLIQRPGVQQAAYKRLSYGCGWDVILPAGYSMAVWLCLIMWGARPGGLREFETLFREMGTEEHLPDTVGGKQVAALKYEELRSKYFRLPPSKRCNYQKFSIVSPFRVPFVALVRDWKLSANAKETDAQSQNFFILRDRILLQDLVDCLKKSNLKKFPPTLPPECLIQLKFTLKCRGNPTDFALVCLPLKKDFKRHLKNIHTHQNEPIFTEPLLKDRHETERKQLRTEHKKLLKRLRGQRVREKRKKQETSTTKVFIRPAGTATICAEQFKKMCALWLPEDFTTLYTVRKQGCREAFGYLTTAHFCLTEGTAGAIGYVTVEGLKQLLQLNHNCRLKQPMCLLRATNSRHYRFATFKVNLDV